jgi:hypothetical protein
MMSKAQGDLTIYFKSYLLAWSRHIRSHIREKRIIPTWIERSWISTFEEALAKTIVHIVISRQAEQTSQAVG